MSDRRELGDLELLLLAVVAREQSHGYAVITQLRRLSGGVLDFPEGNAYPALHKLEKRGAIASRWTVVNGRRRKIYRATEHGLELLGAERQSWEAATNAIRQTLEWSM
jgi:DNA-binding PadR family transcriptional regulator